jgi:hypothetical protein
MAYEDWKERYQREATPEQKAVVRDHQGRH